MQHRKRQITLKQRMGLCLAAFFAAFAMQLTLNGYQSRAVQAVQDAQMGCFNAISRFQGGVESSISVLENYRWENSEPEAIIDRLQSASSTCNAWLWRIGTSLNSLESVSDEQRVLYSAVDTVYQTYTGLLDELENDLLSGNDAAASQLYYAKVVPCGDYLSQYTLQLLETAIQDSQTTYTTISALNERITMLQTVVVALCVALGVVLPVAFHSIPTAGSVLLPMHIPVLLCGFVCGWPWGLAVGFVAPLLRTALFGMPPILTSVAMAFELAAYGACSGALYRLLPKRTPYLYVSLLAAMVLGRIVWGAARFCIAGLQHTEFPLSAFWAGAVINAVPGIVCHIVLIPLIVMALKKGGMMLNGDLERDAAGPRDALSTDGAA